VLGNSETAGKLNKVQLRNLTVLPSVMVVPKTMSMTSEQLESEIYFEIGVIILIIKANRIIDRLQ
jgi:hypothetical protein